MRSIITYGGFVSTASGLSLYNGSPAGSWAAHLSTNLSVSANQACNLFSRQANNYLKAPDGEFHHVALVFDSQAGVCTLYEDGVPTAADKYVGGTTAFAPGPLHLGAAKSAPRRAASEIDEFRILAGTALSADWLATEYSNQRSPAGFYSVGPAETPR